MEFLTSNNLLTIMTVVVSCFGVHYAAKAEKRKERLERERRHEVEEQRREAGEKRLAEQARNDKKELIAAISGHKKETFAAISSLKKETFAAISSHKKETFAAISSLKKETSEAISSLKKETSEAISSLTEAVGELKIAVSVLSTKLDERSYPRRLEHGRTLSGGAGVAPVASVREKPAHYSADEPKDEAKEAPESSSQHPRKEESDQL